MPPSSRRSNDSSESGSMAWATKDDWARHRKTIKQLYVDEEKPLKEVKAMMERDFGFYAT